MISLAKRTVTKLLHMTGYDIVRPDSVDNATKALYRTIEPYTMTTFERVIALRHSVEYIVRHGVAGAFVECGVWKGGSMMAVALTLLELGVADRKLYLYDTFAGMAEPGDLDVNMRNVPAKQFYQPGWLTSPFEEVREAMRSTGYNMENIIFVQGRVEDTLPANNPDSIALLRLDTDWYESTYHELIHLYPLLNRGGVLIIDDYGEWQGSRRATDEYLEQNDIRLLLNRIDYSARIAVKIDD